MRALPPVVPVSPGPSWATTRNADCEGMVVELSMESPPRAICQLDEGLDGGTTAAPMNSARPTWPVGSWGASPSAVRSGSCPRLLNWLPYAATKAGVLDWLIHVPPGSCVLPVAYVDPTARTKLGPAITLLRMHEDDAWPWGLPDASKKRQSTGVTLSRLPCRS